jgi:hypothetical protein
VTWDTQSCELGYKVTSPFEGWSDDYVTVGDELSFHNAVSVMQNAASLDAGSQNLTFFLWDPVPTDPDFRRGVRAASIPSSRILTPIPPSRTPQATTRPSLTLVTAGTLSEEPHRSPTLYSAPTSALGVEDDGIQFDPAALHNQSLSNAPPVREYQEDDASWKARWDSYVEEQKAADQARCVSMGLVLNRVG